MAKPDIKAEPALIGETGIITGAVRIAFSHVLEAAETLNGDMKFSCVLLFDPADPTIALMKKAAGAAAKKKWPEKMPANLRSPFRDGNEKEYQGFGDKVFVSCSAKNKPGVVDQGLKAITSDEPGPGGIYSGAWVRADINAFAYDTKGNQGVSFGLNNIQKLGDDEAFSGRQAPERVFTAVAGDAFTGKVADAGDAIFG